MRISSKIISLVLAVATAFSLVGCGGGGTEYEIGGDIVEYRPEEDKTELFSPEDTSYSNITETEPPETEPPETDPPETAPPASDDIGATVYWVASGEVWHRTSNCSTLSRSKNIFSGSISAAKAAGKDRVCKRCS